ncbi:oxidation resistance protein 1 [Coemansia sp. Benny D115]|nr:oxidation resistance protein 1 [Coemansia sp. Benny D115]
MPQSKSPQLPHAVALPLAPAPASTSIRTGPSPSRVCEPLVSLSKATVECRPAASSSRSSFSSCSPSCDGDPPGVSIRQPTSLSAHTSSFFDLQSFPSRALSFSNPRNEFEQLFDILPDSPESLLLAIPTKSRESRFFIDRDTSDSEDPPSQPTCLQLSFTQPVSSLAMNLRRFVSAPSPPVSEGASPASEEPGELAEGSSFASRFFSFGRRLRPQANDQAPLFDETAGSESQEDQPLASSESTIHSIRQHTSDSRDETPRVTDNPGSLDLDPVSRDTREAMDTPMVGSQGSPGDGNTQASSVETSVQLPPLLSAKRPLLLLGRHDDTPKVLTTTIAEALRPLLPVQQRLAKSWRLVYSMDQQGISMNTMLTRCAGEKELVLAIKDTKGRVFGAFLNEALRLSPTFYGQGTW